MTYTRQNDTAKAVFAASGALSYAIRSGERAETIENLRRDLRAAQLEKYVRKALSEEPPLTSEQVDRVVDILRGVTL